MPAGAWLLNAVSSDVAALLAALATWDRLVVNNLSFQVSYLLTQHSLARSLARRRRRHDKRLATHVGGMSSTTGAR